MRIDRRPDVLVVAVVVGGIAACGGSNAPTGSTASPSEPACRLQVVETVPVAAEADPEGITNADGRLFVSTLDGAVLAGETAETGAALEVLSRPTEARIAAGGLRAVGEGFVVVAGLRARVVDVLDAATGEVLSSQPVLASGLRCIRRSADNAVLRLDTAGCT